MRINAGPFQTVNKSELVGMDILGPLLTHMRVWMSIFLSDMADI